jgi:hypothetical protein
MIHKVKLLMLIFKLGVIQFASANFLICYNLMKVLSISEPCKIRESKQTTSLALISVYTMRFNESIAGQNIQNIISRRIKPKTI